MLSPCPHKFVGELLVRFFHRAKPFRELGHGRRRGGGIGRSGCCRARGYHVRRGWHGSLILRPSALSECLHGTPKADYQRPLKWPLQA